MKITKYKAIATFLILVLISAYFTVLFAHIRESEKSLSAFSFGNTKDPNHLEISMEIISMDPIQQTITAHLSFNPQGNLAVSQEDSILSKDIYLYTNVASGNNKFNFKKNDDMPPMNITYSIYDGRIANYPFDNYNAAIYLDVRSLAKDEKSGTEDLVPVSINLNAAVPGLNIIATKEHSPNQQDVEIFLNVSRSKNTIFYSLFITAAMWLIAGVLISLLISVMVLGRSVEVGMLTFSGGMIFTLPALRNVQPGSPPFGAFSDYLAFFWVQGIAVMSLVILAYYFFIISYKNYRS